LSGGTPYNIGMENSLINSTSDFLKDINSDVSTSTPNIDHLVVDSTSIAGNSAIYPSVWPGAITTVPTQPATDVWTGGFDFSSRETYEFKLVDGTKVIQDLKYSDIVELKEIEMDVPDGHTRKIVHLTLDDRIHGQKTLEIDCNLSMFMKIIGHKYKSWAKSLMEESVKNGSETN